MNKQYFENLAAILICPKTGKPLVYDETLEAFVNKEDNLMYKVEGGIPILLPEEAQEIVAPVSK